MTSDPDAGMGFGRITPLPPGGARPGRRSSAVVRRCADMVGAMPGGGVRTVDVPNVELVRVGHHRASTGSIAIDEAMLADVVAASRDPEVDHAPVKIGHYDTRFSAQDGDPALGWVENLRLVGDRIVGDLKDVPAQLAELLPKAYRRRSVELRSGVTTPSGRTYRAVLHGLALLGITPPAVKGLADVAAIYASADALAPGDDVIDVAVTDGVSASAGAALEDARRSVVALAGTIGADESALLELIDRLDSAAGAPPESQIPRHGAPPVHDGGGSNSDHTGGTVGITDARLREILGLQADADVEGAVRALVAMASDTGNGEGDGGQNGGGEGGGENETGAPLETPSGDDGEQSDEPDDAGDGEGAEEGRTVTITESQLQELVAKANRGDQAFQRQAEADVDRELVAALSEGRIAPSEWESLRQGLLNPASAEVVRANLSARPAGVIAVSETGSALAQLSSGDGANDAAWAAFEKQVFGIDPSEQKAGA